MRGRRSTAGSPMSTAIRTSRRTLRRMSLPTSARLLMFISSRHHLNGTVAPFPSHQRATGCSMPQPAHGVTRSRRGGGSACGYARRPTIPDPNLDGDQGDPWRVFARDEGAQLIGEVVFERELHSAGGRDPAGLVRRATSKASAPPHEAVYNINVAQQIAYAVPCEEETLYRGCHPHVPEHTSRGRFSQGLHRYDA